MQKMKCDRHEVKMYNSNKIKILLGKRVKELRKKRNLTQKELAEKMNIDQRNLSKIECGNNFITAETLSKILFALDIEIEDLFNFNSEININQIKKELLFAINNELIDIKLMYKFYKSIQ